MLFVPPYSPRIDSKRKGDEKRGGGGGGGCRVELDYGAELSADGHIFPCFPLMAFFRGGGGGGSRCPTLAIAFCFFVGTLVIFRCTVLSSCMNSITRIWGRHVAVCVCVAVGGEGGGGSKDEGGGFISVWSGEAFFHTWSPQHLFLLFFFFFFFLYRFCIVAQILQFPQLSCLSSLYILIAIPIRACVLCTHALDFFHFKEQCVCVSLSSVGEGCTHDLFS